MPDESRATDRCAGGVPITGMRFSLTGQEALHGFPFQYACEHPGPTTPICEPAVRYLPPAVLIANPLDLYLALFGPHDGADLPTIRAAQFHLKLLHLIEDAHDRPADLARLKRAYPRAVAAIAWYATARGGPAGDLYDVLDKVADK